MNAIASLINIIQTKALMMCMGNLYAIGVMQSQTHIWASL